MAEFCSGPLWNTTLTWNSEKPDFTSCFHKTVLVYMPCFVLWILAPLEIWSNCKSSKRFIQFSWVNVSKILLDFCLVATTTVELLLINRLYNNPDIGNGSKMADFVASGLKLITFCLDFALVLLAKRSGQLVPLFSTKIISMPGSLLQVTIFFIRSSDLWSSVHVLDTDHSLPWSYDGERDK